MHLVVDFLLLTLNFHLRIVYGDYMHNLYFRVKMDPTVLLWDMRFWSFLLIIVLKGFDLHYQSIVAVPEVTHVSHHVGGPLRYEKRRDDRDLRSLFVKYLGCACASDRSPCCVRFSFMSSEALLGQ